MNLKKLTTQKLQIIVTFPRKLQKASTDCRYFFLINPSTLFDNVNKRLQILLAKCNSKIYLKKLKHFAWFY